MSWSHYLFSFDGRINRAKWWLFLLVAVAYVIASFILFFVFGMIVGVLATIWAVLSLLGGLLLAYASFAVGAKRLHDRTKSAWWLLAFYALPYVLVVVTFSTVVWGALAGTGAPGADPGAPGGMAEMIVMGGWWLNVVLAGVLLWGVIELGILKGTDGSNRYGADPLRAL